MGFLAANWQISTTVMNTFPLKAVEAQPRRILRVVKGKVACKVASFDSFTPRVPEAWTCSRPVHMLATSDDVKPATKMFDCETISIEDVDCCEKAVDFQLCEEKLVQLCERSIQKDSELLVLKVFSTWRNFTVAVCAQAWCTAIHQEKDDAQLELAKVKEHQEQYGELKTKMHFLDRCRSQAETQLRSANETVKHLWQELGDRAQELRESRADNRSLRERIENLNRQLSESLSRASSRTTENEVLKVEVRQLEEGISKLQPSCVVCMGTAAVIAFSPCGHLATCQPCARKLTSRECPICRERIVQELHIFTP